MNKFELDKTMECFGYIKSNSYEFYNLTLYHDNRYFTIVNGKTPYELAKLIKEKYDNNKYQIRVEGNNEYYEPTTDVYTYHIDTIEGLVAFLIETKNYYSKTHSNQDELSNILNLIYIKILKNVKPEVKIYEWMLNRDNKKDYFKTLLSNNTYLDYKLRRKIESFDSLVSPYTKEELNINDNNFIVRGYGYKEEDSWFTLTDEESNISLYTIRDKNGFVLRLRIPTNLPYEINVLHYFDKNGEELAFEKYDENNLIRIEYNLTNKLFGEHYGEKRQATIDDKKLVIKYLDEYISLVKTIVNKNIYTKPNDKNLILTKNKTIN